MWYVFVMSAAYSASGMFYRSVARKFSDTGSYESWLGFALLVWLLFLFVTLYGLARGIPFFLAAFAVSGPVALAAEALLPARWKGTVYGMAGLALLSGVVVTAGRWAA